MRAAIAPSSVEKLTSEFPATLVSLTGNRQLAVAAWATPSGTRIDLRRNHIAAWHADLPGTAGPIALAPGTVVAAVTTEQPSGLSGNNQTPIRGEPGSVLVGLDATTGSSRWQLAFHATDWALITSVAVDGSHIAVGGTFSGTLRVDTAVVSSGGATDGFVARLDLRGALLWLARIGGPGPDGISAVAARRDAIAIAGTVAAGAEFLGHPVEPRNGRSPYGDSFVAMLGTRGDHRWSQTFGGPGAEFVAGVAINASHGVAVATTIADRVRVGTSEVAPRGATAGLVVLASPGGQLGPIALVNASGGLRLASIAAVGDRVVVGGVFTGTFTAGETSVTAIGNDDAFLASVTSTGNLEGVWHLAGQGREEVVSVTAVPGGFLAGVAYSGEVAIGPDRLAAPVPPATGAAIVMRPMGKNGP